MRSYRIDINRLVNQLVPHYLGGRKLILLLQSMLSPLDSLNLKWNEWANNKRSEAALTSQVIVFEHYLTKQFSKYFLDSTQSIVITDGETGGAALYWQNSKLYGTWSLYKDDGENTESTTSLYYNNEATAYNDVSFVVVCPAVDTEKITEEEITAMLKYYIDRYKVSGKEYKIVYT